MGNWWDNINDPVATPAPSQGAAPGTTPGTMDYYDRYAQQPAPSTSLPNPGDPTSFSPQGSAAGLKTPDRLSDDTLLALGLNAAEGGRNSATILNNDPGSAYATTYAKNVATDNADVADLQNAAQPLLRRVQDFRNIATKAGPDVLGKATGPDYGGPWIPLPDTSSPMYQNARQAFQHLNPFSDQDSYRKATDANLEMQHLKDAIAASFKQLPGSGRGGATDQAQRTVDNMLGHALNAQDPETFYKIVHDAMNTIRGFARLPDLPDNDASVPTDKTYGWTPPANASPGTATRSAVPASPVAPPVQRATPPLDSAARANAIARAKNALSKGVPRDQVLQRLKELGVQ